MKIKNLKKTNKIRLTIIIIFLLFIVTINIDSSNNEIYNDNYIILAEKDYNKLNADQNLCINKSETVKKEDTDLSISLLSDVDNATKEEKKILSREEILTKFNLTEYEFNVVVGVVLAEAKNNDYDDAYAVINTLYNRTICKRWVRSVNGHGLNGYSLYGQAVSPNQFTVYQSGSYLRHIGDTTSIGYGAIIDFLSTLEIKHKYLNFASSRSAIAEYEQFTENGNKYYRLMDDNEIITLNI